MHTALRDVNAVERLETGRALASCTLQAPDGRIGGVEQFYFDDQYWLVRYLVVNTGSWLTGRRVLIAPSAILGLSVHDRWLRVGLTREQIRNSPSVDTRKPVSRRYEERYYTYYDWPPYWDTALVPGVFLPNRTKAAPAIATGALEEPDPKQTHLRSSSEVKGYRIGAQDGAFGHVEDFLVDTGAWSVRYLEIDTRNGWPGRHVLISPAWIEAVDWVAHSVSVGLKRDVIRSAPEYDSPEMITRAYEVRLYRHYGSRGYWQPEESAD